MKVKVKDLQSNPFKKYINNGKLEEEKLLIIKESVQFGTLPEQFVAVKRNNEYCLCFGHHRLEALKREKGTKHEVDVTIVEYSDEKVLIDLIRENLTQRNLSYNEIVDASLLIKNWLESGAKTVEEFDKYMQNPFHKNKQNVSAKQIEYFISKSGKTIKAGQISKYLDIEENLVPELKDKVVKGSKKSSDKDKVGVELASTLSTFGKNEQLEIYKVAKKSNMNEENTFKALKKFKKLSKPIQDYVKKENGTLDEIKELQNLYKTVEKLPGTKQLFSKILNMENKNRTVFIEICNNMFKEKKDFTEKDVNLIIDRIKAFEKTKEEWTSYKVNELVDTLVYGEKIDLSNCITSKNPLESFQNARDVIFKLDTSTIDFSDKKLKENTVIELRKMYSHLEKLLVNLGDTHPKINTIIKIGCEKNE